MSDAQTTGPTPGKNTGKNPGNPGNIGGDSSLPDDARIRILHAIRSDTGWGLLPEQPACAQPHVGISGEAITAGETTPSSHAFL